MQAVPISMNRRRLLKLSLFSSLALVSAGAVSSVGWLLSGYPGATPGPRLLPGKAGSDDGKRRGPPRFQTLGARHQSILSAVALRVLDGALGGGKVGGSATDGAAREPDPADVGPACLFMDRYLGGMDASIQSDFRALLDLLEYLPLVTGFGGRFTRLSPAAQDQVLSGWQRSPRALLRQGAQALRSLCLLAHYQDPASFAAIGYSGPLVPAGPDASPPR